MLPQPRSHQEFPRFPRAFPAMGLLLALLLLNILQPILFPMSKEKTARQQLLASPYDASAHHRLAQLLVNINAAAAEKEFLLTEMLQQSKTPHVLGVRTSAWEEWVYLQEEQERILDRLVFWETVHKKFPDFQYATAYLASQYAAIGDKEKSIEYQQILLHEHPEGKFTEVVKTAFEAKTR